MNERVTDEQIRQKTDLAIGSLRPTSMGISVRIDPAHAFPAGENPSGSESTAEDRADETLETQAVAELRRRQATATKPISNVARLDTQFLNEVSQLAQQLHLQIQSEKDELETRELALRDQQSIFEMEKQRFIHEIANDLSQLETQKAELQKSDTTLAERQIEFELQSRQFETERELLHTQRTELEQRKQSVRSDVLAELQTERNEFERVKATLREEQDRVQLLKAWLQQRLDELAIENDRTLQSEREKLWQSLTTEWEQRQVAFQRDKEEWIKTRDLEKSEIDREKALFESTVSSANVEFLAARESLAAELSDLREQQTRRLQAEQIEWKQSRESEEMELLAIRRSIEKEITESRDEQTTILQGERAAWEDARHAEEAELYATRESLNEELSALREQHDENLRAERSEWEQTLEREKVAFSAQQAELLRERTLIENRIRFQQDHLEKSRAEFEQAQNAHRHERQVERQRIEEAGLLMIRRLRQIDLYRSSIDEREKSLDRELELFGRTQKAITNTVDLDRLALQVERDAWEQERQIQQADVRRQKEAMATLSESLESRRVRLDKLRAELEETHRATLEMRLAVEEAWAQLTQAAGQDDARQRVEQVRESLIGYYQQMHDTLEEQRREQFDALSKFERQRAEFAEERQKLANWMAGRDEELKLGEERLRTAATDASSNNANWLAARDRWLLEKAEAEKLIRRLLASLGETNRDQSREIEAVLALNEEANDSPHSFKHPASTDQGND